MSYAAWMPVSCALMIGAWVQQQPRPSTPPANSPEVAAGESAEKQAAFLKRLERVDAAMQRVVDLRADFEQRRHTALLKRPLVSKGVLLTRGDTVRWNTKEPRASSMVVGEGKIRMYYPDDKLLEVYPTGGDFKDVAGAPLPRLSQLRERFDISPLDPKDLGAPGDNPHLVAMRLTPRSEELRRHIQSVQVLIDDTGPAATKVIMVNQEGERTEIAFTNIRINTGVKQNELDLNLPTDVRVSHPLGEEKPNEGVGTMPPVSSPTDAKPPTQPPPGLQPEKKP